MVLSSRCIHLQSTFNVSLTEPELLKCLLLPKFFSVHLDELDVNLQLLHLGLEFILCCLVFFRMLVGVKLSASFSVIAGDLCIRDVFVGAFELSLVAEVGALTQLQGMSRPSPVVHSSGRFRMDSNQSARPSHPSHSLDRCQTDFRSKHVFKRQ